ncbi:hypothetical protein Bca52824_079255 [Brassica carinata]|uniref:RNase H type-1 domain-containing protein n=1 Tax=Brassica carinata TaxID=52824 RepID=A0A8X7PXN3_BRACI|nr:hypothetical protein Bca52824_079255 [Brassica carinata]
MVGSSKTSRADAHEWSNYNQTQLDSNNVGLRHLDLSKLYGKPAEGWLKCNVDGSLRIQSIARGGWVVRDSNGMFVTAGHAEGMIVYSALKRISNSTYGYTILLVSRLYKSDL